MLTVITVDGRNRDLSEPQFANAPSSIATSVSESETFESEEQPSKQFLPIVPTPERDTVLREVQPENAPAPTEPTVSGRITASKPSQPENAPAPMPVTLIPP